MTNLHESDSKSINNSKKSVRQKKPVPDSDCPAVLSRPRFSLRTHILLMFILLSSLSIALVVGSVIAINHIQKKNSLLQISEKYLFVVEQARRWEKNYFLYGTNLEDATQSANNAKKILSNNLTKVTLIFSPEETATVIQHLDKYRELLQELTVLEKNMIKNTEKKHEIETSLRKHGAEMVNVAAAIVHSEQLSINAMLKLIQRIPVYSLAVVLLLTTFLVCFFVKRLIKPLKLLVESTQKIAKGDFSPIPPMCKYRGEFTTVELAINQMIQELKLREVAMIESHKLRAIGTLTAGVAHELNNPLNNIMLTAHAMLEDYKDLSKDELLEMINDVINEADRSRKIIRNLLDFAREGESVSEPINLGVLVNETIKLAQNQIKVSGAKIETQIQTHLPQIRGDKQQLKQVFLNLILNALDAVKKDGTIKISLEQADNPGFIAVQVEDNGCGIPAYILPNIFDPFFTTKGPGKGTGLGLSVSHGIVNIHGGQISIESEEGKYSRFTVILPALNIPVDLKEKSEKRKAKSEKRKAEDERRKSERRKMKDEKVKDERRKGERRKGERRKGERRNW
ncbi:MAG: HAMP domain-containing protein [Deltaproteobacteria bacterium]|nr:HAMP domain-containing protein [Deltaproteobacteria bacterium]